jgi:hypothetical protein
MQKRGKSARFLGISLALTFGVFGLALTLIAQGPDRELQFLREVPSQLDPERIDRNISAVSRWPQWFYSTADVQIQNPDKNAPHLIQPGSLLTIQIDPHKGERKRFQMKAEVLEYQPQKEIRMKILSDSSGRLTHAFDDIEWSIHLQPQGTGTLIQGKVRVHTKHWRSRLFGKISEKILLNQIFYPNLVKLAELKQPFSMDSGPQPNLYSP